MGELLECGTWPDLGDALRQQVTWTAAGLDELGQVGDRGGELGRNSLGGDSHASTGGAGERGVI
jgi:hypothetical protein